MIIWDGVRDFDLDHIFDCGQCFRWEKQADGSYSGVAAGAPPASIAFYPSRGERYHGRLAIDDSGGDGREGFWRNYLDIERDYGKIKEDLAKGDPVMAKAVEFGQGIRILNQDKWETLISFIISQNNNIKRIKGCINSLCENFGDFTGEYAGKEYFSMPGADILAGLTEGDLAVCRLGYRAKYLIETAKAIRSDGGERLNSLSRAPAAEAFGYLTGLCGVGPKVANCIMLFSMGKFASFPIDVWVRQAMSRLYGMDRQDMKAMAEYAAVHFGEYGGIAQQYLFYYMKSQRAE